MAGEYEFRDKVTIPVDEALKWQEEIYRAAGMNEKDARLVADNLVVADLRGVYSHGIMRTPVYVGHFKTGNIDPAARPEIVRESAASALVDGHNGMGMVVAAFATELAISMGKKSGSAAVSMTGSNHLGTCAYYAEMAADADMIGMFWSISGGNNMAPWGGAMAQLGNNPFAVAAPCKTRPNVVMDMASSVVAMGKIMVAAKSGGDIPPGWALDKDGRPTTDVQAALEGTLLPVGGYKGAALSFMIAAVTCILNGSKCGPTMADMYKNPNEPLNSGHLVQVIDIASITDPDAFKERMDGMVDYIKNGPRAEGVPEIFVPGEPESRMRARQLAEGIVYPTAVVEEIRAVADEYGVRTPA